MADDPSAPLPQVDLLHGSTITVELDVAGAQITALNVHGYQEEDNPVTVVPLVPGELPAVYEA